MHVVKEKPKQMNKQKVFIGRFQSHHVTFIHRLCAPIGLMFT